MNDIKKIIQLDYLAIRPYFTYKNLLIFISLSIFYAYLAKNATATFSMPILFALIFSSYPFLSGDEAGIDSLYRIFGISKNSVVYGRYVFAFLLSIASVISGLTLFVITSFLFKYNLVIDSFENNIFVSLIIIIFVIAVQYPLYFKYGYTKAKTLAIIPFILFGIFASLLSLFKKEIMDIMVRFGENNNVMSIAILCTFIIVCSVLLISIIVSKKIYNKRDF